MQVVLNFSNDVLAEKFIEWFEEIGGSSLYLHGDIGQFDYTVFDNQINIIEENSCDFSS
jgi:hypothetical protein